MTDRPLARSTVAPLLWPLLWHRVGRCILLLSSVSLICYHLQIRQEASRAHAEVVSLQAQNATLRRDLAVLQTIVETQQVKKGYDEGDPAERQINAAFLLAVSKGDYATATALRDRGANPNACDASGQTALHHAASDNDLKKVQWLLDHGSNPNVKDDRGWTPLARSATYGLTEGDFGDFVGQGDVNQRVPIHAVMALLLENGAHVDARNDMGTTALMLVAHYTQSLDCLRLLLDHGADIHQKDNDDQDALEYALSCGDNFNGPENHERVVAFLRERSASRPR